MRSLRVSAGPAAKELVPSAKRTRLVHFCVPGAAVPGFPMPPLRGWSRVSRTVTCPVEFVRGGEFATADSLGGLRVGGGAFQALDRLLGFYLLRTVGQDFQVGLVFLERLVGLIHFFQAYGQAESRNRIILFVE